MGKVGGGGHTCILKSLQHCYYYSLNLLVPRYTKTNIGNPGNQQNRVGRQGTLLCKEINIGYL